MERCRQLRVGGAGGMDEEGETAVGERAWAIEVGVDEDWCRI